MLAPLIAAAWLWSWDAPGIGDGVRVRAAGQIVAEVAGVSARIEAEDVTATGLVEWRFAVYTATDEGPPTYDYTCHAASADCWEIEPQVGPWIAASGCGAAISDNGYATPPVTCSFASLSAGALLEVAIEAHGGTVGAKPTGLGEQLVAFAGTDATVILSWPLDGTPTAVALRTDSGAPRIDQVRARVLTTSAYECDAERDRFRVCCQQVGGCS